MPLSSRNVISRQTKHIYLHFLYKGQLQKSGNAVPQVLLQAVYQVLDQGDCSIGTRIALSIY